MTLNPSSHHLLSSHGADSTKKTSQFRGLPRLFSKFCSYCWEDKTHGEEEILYK